MSGTWQRSCLCVMSSAAAVSAEVPPPITQWPDDANGKRSACCYTGLVLHCWSRPHPEPTHGHKGRPCTGSYAAGAPRGATAVHAAVGADAGAEAEAGHGVRHAGDGPGAPPDTRSIRSPALQPLCALNLCICTVQFIRSRQSCMHSPHQNGMKGRIWPRSGW